MKAITVRQPSLEQHVHALFTARDLTLAAAESCTGGLFSFRVTSVPGSSAYFLGGVVAYSNDLKRSLLGVSSATLDNLGAVSMECAREMAIGARELTGADVTISTTGIAGPGGATARKPVGLIYVACATPDDVVAQEVRWQQSRAKNMRDASDLALQLLLRETNRYLESADLGNRATRETTT